MSVSFVLKYHLKIQYRKKGKTKHQSTLKKMFQSIVWNLWPTYEIAFLHSHEHVLSKLSHWCWLNIWIFLINYTTINAKKKTMNLIIKQIFYPPFVETRDRQAWREINQVWWFSSHIELIRSHQLSASIISPLLNQTSRGFNT